MKDQTISASIAMQSKANAERRKKEVEKNRSLLRRIVDTIIWGPSGSLNAACQIMNHVI